MVKVVEPPVCTEPKVFVGSIPLDTTADDVTRVFGRYGNLKSVAILTTPDGRSRGCAMLLYDTWTAAEAAIEAENGTTSLGGALGKGMVVKFADPPKRGGQDGGPVVGLVPRKLFIGQVPAGTTHDALRALFAPYGNVQDMHIVQKQMGAGCALLTFQKWASCEASIEAHNGKTVMTGGTSPLVVRFADAKAIDPASAYAVGGTGQKRQFGANEMQGMVPNKRQFGGAGGMAGGFPNPYFGMMPGMQGGMMGFGMQGQGFVPNGMQGMGAYNIMQNAAAMSAMRLGSSGSAGGPDHAGAMGGGGAGLGGQGGGGAGGLGAGGAAGGGMPGGMGGGLMGGGGVGGMMQAGLGGRPGFGGFGGGMKGAGVNEVAKQWKLFIGQIPYEAEESDLWPLLSSYGNILELTILRNAGKSKGCGFCTYENYASAAAAATQLNNVAGIDNDPRGRKLIVKFANPTAAMAAANQQQVQGGQLGGAPGQASAMDAQTNMMMMQGGQGGAGQYIGPAQQMQAYQQQQQQQQQAQGGGGMMMMM